MHILAPRYQDRKGGYVRILKNGHRSRTSDRAPLAIVELVNNPNDIVYHLAKTQLTTVQEQLKNIEEKKYSRESILLRDLHTGEAFTAVKLKDRANITAKEKRQFSRVELGLQKKMLKFNKSMETFPLSRQMDTFSAEKLKNVQPNESIEFFMPPPSRWMQVLPSASKMKVLKRQATQIVPEKEQLQPDVVDSTPAKPPPKSFVSQFFGKWFNKSH
jgi:hypothetical protein